MVLLSVDIQSEKKVNWRLTSSCFQLWSLYYISYVWLNRRRCSKPKNLSYCFLDNLGYLKCLNLKKESTKQKDLVIEIAVADSSQLLLTLFGNSLKKQDKYFIYIDHYLYLVPWGIFLFLYRLLNLFKENCSCNQILFADFNRRSFFKSRFFWGSLIKQTININSAGHIFHLIFSLL